MKLTTMILLILLLGVTMYSQPTVDSGSTGADGPFNPPGQVPDGTQVVGNCTAAPGCTVTVPLREPPDHIFNFTTVTIGPFVTVKFTRNAANTPVFILAQGDVRINGTIDVSGQNAVRSFTAATAGPGGYSGGLGGIPGTLTGLGGAGSGPGGGAGGGDPGWGPSLGEGGAFGVNGSVARMYGIPELLPLIGGSGGGAGNIGAGIPGGNGGGGGGALLIASSTVIDVGSGSGNAIVANGGVGEVIGFAANGGGGSGGAIRLVATLLSGRRGLAAAGGVVSGSFGGGPGRIRLDSARPGEYTGSTTPPGIATFNEPGQPIIVFPPTTPTVRIVSVASIPTPAQPTFEAGTPDITLPINFMNPVSIVIEATNVASGTQARVLSTPQYGGGARVIAGPVALTGPAGQPKRATVTVTLPARGAGILSAVIDTVVPEGP